MTTRRLVMRLPMVFAALVVVAATAAGRAQTELDRIVARVNNRIITQSDVRQARALGLVRETASDEATLRALEDRLLLLAEVGRSAPLRPTTEEDLARRRAAWEARVGGVAKAAALLSAERMSAPALDGWFRDDLRIEAHLGRQFGSIPEPERQQVIAEWMDRLRQRAGLR